MSGKHIIIADDNKIVRDFLETSLYETCIKNKIQMHIASNANATFQKLQSLKRENNQNNILLTTDFQFSGEESDGLDLIQLIIMKYKEQRPFIVLLTAIIDLSDTRVKKAWDLANEVKIKPRGILEIKDVVKNYFNCPFEKTEKILPMSGRIV